MIASKTPFRLILGGGGTDLPSYSSKYGGFVVTSALDKYVYLVVNRRFEEEIRISYSVTEIVKSVDDIRHPVVKERARAKEPCGAQDPYIAAFGGEEGQLV